MNLMMKMIIAMMKMVPKGMADKMAAPMVAKEKIESGKNNPAGIKINLTNLLICAEYCGSCSSQPKKRPNALFCALGKSELSIEENGCNCFDCPLIDGCGLTQGYFCKHGMCPGKGESEIASRPGVNDYLTRFLISADEKLVFSKEKDNRPNNFQTGEKIIDITIQFQDDKEVKTKSDKSILQASLDAGIFHTHACGGRARCSTCRVLVLQGLEYCKKRNNKERHLASQKGFSPDIRLACQTKLSGDVTVRRLVLDGWDASSAIFGGRQFQGSAGIEKHLTILFADIRSFTSFSEKNLPYDIVHILNRYFDAIGEAIDINGGYIDKYMGDGIMAIFGLDRFYMENSSFLAIHAAFDMMKSLQDFNTYLKHYFDLKFNIGIGIHTGSVIIGNVGFHKKMEFTAIGDTVNTASRIESVNKKASTSILVSGQTYQEIKDRFQWGRKIKATVKGKEHPFYVYEPTNSEKRELD